VKFFDEGMLQTGFSGYIKAIFEVEKIRFEAEFGIKFVE